MKTKFYFIFFILLFGSSFAQIDTDLIKKNVTENPTENFYPLLEKFKTNPSELTQEQFRREYLCEPEIKSLPSIVEFQNGERLGRS